MLYSNQCFKHLTVLFEVLQNSKINSFIASSSFSRTKILVHSIYQLPVDGSGMRSSCTHSSSLVLQQHLANLYQHPVLGVKFIKPHHTLH